MMDRSSFANNGYGMDGRTTDSHTTASMDASNTPAITNNRYDTDGRTIEKCATASAMNGSSTNGTVMEPTTATMLGGDARGSHRGDMSGGDARCSHRGTMFRGDTGGSHRGTMLGGDARGSHRGARDPEASHRGSMLEAFHRGSMLGGDAEGSSHGGASNIIKAGGSSTANMKAISTLTEGRGTVNLTTSSCIVRKNTTTAVGHCRFSSMEGA